MNKVSLALVIHSHQPVGNFDHVIEDAYVKCYAPFVRKLQEHPGIRLSLHFSGILLEWLDHHHPEYIDQLRELSEQVQIEMVGGGYYEPILAAIPDTDKIAQVRKLSDYINRHFGAPPGGAWIAERVWEPTLPRPLAMAGVDYVVLDDTHFLAAGLQPWQLHGSFITEEDGHPLRLVPSLKSLRYTIPFQAPEETLKILREGVGKGEALFAMGDDCEKFGVWPGTYDHVYKDGWLEDFLQALEDADDWLETTTVANYLSTHPPVGRIYLPTASYAEMMEWSLPPAVATDFHHCLEETEHLRNGERFQRFLHGGMWRNFLAKYSESNNIQKRVLAVSHRLQQVSGSVEMAGEQVGLIEKARTHLLSSQCNDPFWHGVFGGLYAPHLRSALLRNLIEADFLLDRVEGKNVEGKSEIVSKDFDFDGREEILIRQNISGMTLHPADGATASSLCFQPSNVELINSLMRRPEAYHDLVRKHVNSNIAPREGPASIHDQVLAKEAHLDHLLRYDRYARHSFRTYVFPASKNWEDFELLRLDENEALAHGAWETASIKGTTVDFHTATNIDVDGRPVKANAHKAIASKVSGSTWQIECKSSLNTDHTASTELIFGLELVLNLLAPDAHDRYFLAEDVHRPLNFRGEIDSPKLILVDEWQRVKITLETKPHATWWIVPIETISQSESGFERVYQGSAILAVWKIDPSTSRNVSCVLHMQVEPWQDEHSKA